MISSNSQNPDVSGEPGSRRLRASWVLAALWFALFIGSAFLHRSPTGGLLWALQLLILLVIVLLHGSILYGWIGISVYVVSGLIVSVTFEATSISFGFPYGSYVHNAPGFRIFEVPPVAAFIYLIYGWFALALARVFCLDRPARLDGAARFIIPIIAAFILAGYDYPIDPIMASVAHLWTFIHPSGQFGVPISNFLGWIVTGWVIFQIVALTEVRFPASSSSSRKSYWMLPCLIWIAQAAQFPIMWWRAPSGTVDLGSRTFIVSDIYEAAFAASLFTVLFTGLFGLVRLFSTFGSRSV